MTTRRKAPTLDAANKLYDSVIDKDPSEGELHTFIRDRVKGGLFDAVLLRCTVFVYILVGLLGGGNMSRHKVKIIDEPDLMKWTMEQRVNRRKSAD